MWLNEYKRREKDESAQSSYKGARNFVLAEYLHYPDLTACCDRQTLAISGTTDHAQQIRGKVKYRVSTMKRPNFGEFLKIDKCFFLRSEGSPAYCRCSNSRLNF
jgi:hypothetical protein